MKEGLTLYLWDREEQDGWDRILDLVVTVSPNPDWINREEYKTDLRETKPLSHEEIIELLKYDRGSVKQAALSKFGIENLKAGPGIPKGPYTVVDEDVYEAIQKYKQK